MKSKTTAMIAIFAVIVIVVTLMYFQIIPNNFFAKKAAAPKKTPPPTFAPTDAPTTGTGNPFLDGLRKRILYYRENGFEGVLPSPGEV
jgi:hypothetical protein